MLTGAGYFDRGGAPRGVLYFQPSSLPKRRIARPTYIRICKLLLEQATFCEGQADREMVSFPRKGALSVVSSSCESIQRRQRSFDCDAQLAERLAKCHRVRTQVENTCFAMQNVEPPPLADDVIAVPAYVPPAPKPALPVADTLRQRSSSSIAHATPRQGSGGGIGVSHATPRQGNAFGAANATPRLGRGVSSPLRGSKVVGGATPRENRRENIGRATPRGGVGRFTPRYDASVSRATPRVGALPRYDC